MRVTSFYIDKEPQPWQRPKTRVVNGWVQHYSPEETKKFEKAVADVYKARKDPPFFERHTAISVTILFGLPIPKSYTKWRVEAIKKGTIKHTKRPDVDNLAKAILDALNGVAWADDAQITQMIVKKEYVTKPCIWVQISEDVY